MRSREVGVGQEGRRRALVQHDDSVGVRTTAVHAVAPRRTWVSLALQVLRERGYGIAEETRPTRVELRSRRTTLPLTAHGAPQRVG